MEYSSAPGGGGFGAVAGDVESAAACFDAPGGGGVATVPWRVFLSECPGETAASATSSFECTDANHDRTSSTTSSRSGEAGARTASAGVFAGVGCVSLFPGVHAAAALTMAAAATAFVTVGLTAPPVRVTDATSPAEGSERSAASTVEAAASCGTATELRR